MDDYEYGVPDPEYGVFGDPIEQYRAYLTERDIKNINRQNKRRMEEQRVSSDFNRHMIDLFNNSR